MNDITALMATMKAAAEKAGCEQWQSKKNGPGEYGVMVKGSMVKHSGWSTHRPVCDEAVDKKTADFIAAANPANVLALVEALEKAQQENTAGVAGMAESYETTISMLKRRIAELEREKIAYESVAMALRDDMRESRTITVKLPELPVLGSNAEWYQGYAAGTSSMRKGCATALRAAGIQVIEGDA